MVSSEDVWADSIIDKELVATGLSYEKTQNVMEDFGEHIVYELEEGDGQTLELLTLEGLVTDDYPFYGLSKYLGAAHAIEVFGGRVKYLESNEQNVAFQTENWVGFKGRFKTVLVRAPDAEILVGETGLSIKWPSESSTTNLEVLIGRIDTDQDFQAALGLDVRRIQYSHLWQPLAVLTRWVEALFKTIQTITGLSWGWALVLFALIMKVLMFPFSLLTKVLQKQADVHKKALEPVFAEIKNNFKGELAHKKTMAAYKARGITPYYILKPLLVTLLSIPVLIAVFNMLGEVDVFENTPFLWAESLAYPDSLAKLPAIVPLLGDELNLMPFFMAGVTIISALLLKNPDASTLMLKAQRRNLYLMTIVFFVLFYPFPVAMVLYWTLYNVAQLGINLVTDKRSKNVK